MNNFSQKIRLIYLPFLLISIAFIVVYSALNWWMFMKNDFWGVKEDMSIVILPIILPWIPALFLIRPKANLLYLKTKRSKNLLGVYLFVSALSMAFPTIIAQKYLLTATGKLTALNTINDINNQPLTKFYTIKSHYIDKSRLRVRYTYSITNGKTGQYRNRYMYIVSPIYDGDMAPVLIGTLKNGNPQPDTSTPKEKMYMIDGSPADSSDAALIPKDSIASSVILSKAKAIKQFGKAGSNGAVIIKTKGFRPLVIAPPQAPENSPIAWLGVNYREVVNNRASSEELKASSEAFYNTSLDQFKGTNLEIFTYLDRIGNNDDRERYIKAVLGKQHATATIRPIILEPRFNDFTERNGYKLAWTFGSFAIGAIVFLLMLIKPKFKDSTQE